MSNNGAAYGMKEKPGAVAGLRSVTGEYVLPDVNAQYVQAFNAASLFGHL